MRRFREKFSGVDFRHKNDPIPPFSTYEFSFKIQNSPFKPLFNACHEIQFQKILMYRFCLTVDFGPKNAPFISFWA